MNPLDNFRLNLTEAVEANPLLRSTLHSGRTGWLDYGLPPSGDESLFPLMRITGLVDNHDKLGSYTAFLNFWSQDMSYRFFELAEELKGVLDEMPDVQATGYIHRPEEARSLNCVQFGITIFNQ